MSSRVNFFRRFRGWMGGQDRDGKRLRLSPARRKRGPVGHFENLEPRQLLAAWPQWPIYPVDDSVSLETVYVNQNGDAALADPSLNAGEFDGYRLYWQESGSASVETTGLIDTRMAYYEGSGNPVTTDNDSGEGSNARIGTDVAARNDLGFVVAGFETSTTGPYRLLVDGPASSGTVQIPINASRYGTSGWNEIGGEWEYDFYRFTTTTAGDWKVELSAQGDLDATLVVYDAAGNPVGGSFTRPIDAGEEGEDEKWTGNDLAPNATYYIRVDGADASTGYYKLDVRGPSSWPAWPEYPFSDANYERTLYVNQNGDAHVSDRSLARGEFDGYRVYWHDAGSAAVETEGLTDTRLAYYEGPGKPDSTDNDSGSGSNARIHTDVAARFDLGFAVAGFDASTSGNYGLDVDGPEYVGTVNIDVDPGSQRGTSGWNDIGGEWEYDFYRFTTTSAGDWSVLLSATGDWNPTLLVFDEDGNAVGGSFTSPINDGGPGESEQWAGTGLTAGATYYLRVDGQGADTGNYKLDVRGPADWAAWPDYPFTGSEFEGTVYVNQNGDATITGRELTPGDYDGYQIYWDEDNAGTATAAVQTTGPTVTRMAFYDIPGPPATTDNLDGTWNNARILVDPLTAQTDYGFSVSGYRPSTAGPYGLMVDGPASTAITEIPIDPLTRRGSTGPDAIGNAWDYNFYSFTTTASGTWSVVISVEDGLDPTLVVFDEEGNPVGGSFLRAINEGGSGADEWWTGTGLSAGKTYYVRVDGLGSSTGNYTVDVRGPSDWPQWSRYPFAGSDYERTLYVNQFGDARVTDHTLSPGDLDGYRLFWNNDGTAVVETTGLIDTRLAYYEGYGKPDLTDNDSGAGSNARITTGVVSRYDLGFAVTGYDGLTTGEYGMTVDGPSAAGVVQIPISSSRRGTSGWNDIGGEWEYDFYRFTTTTAGTWNVTLSLAGDWDATLMVFDSSGEPVGGSFTSPLNDGGPGEDEQWSGTGLAPSATYYVRVDGVDTDTGLYKLDVRGPSSWPQWPDYPLSGSNYESTLYVNQNGDAWVTDRSLTASDFDGYKVYWHDAGTAVVETTGLTDTRMAYYEGYGKADATDNDSGAGSNARITAAVASRYDLGFCVSGYDPSTTGAYGLTVDGPGYVETAEIPIDSARSGSSGRKQIEGEWEYDFYRFTTTTFGTWSVTLSQSASADWDPTLMVFNSEGKPVGGSFTSPLNDHGPGEGERWTGTGLTPGATYYVRVDGLGTDTGHYTLDVQGPAVVSAADDVYDVNENVPLDVSAAQGLLANDGGAGGSTRETLLVGASPSHGSLTLNLDGSFTYTPAAGFNGIDSFDYQIRSGLEYSNTAHVMIRVTRPLDTTDFSYLEAQTLTGGEVWYRLRTAAAGLLTVEALVPPDAPQVQVELFNRDFQPLLPFGGPRVEYQVGAAGETYFARITGTAPQFDLRVTNLVAVAGNEMTVGGTANDDAFTFSAGAAPYITIRGVRYDVPGNITRVSFDGGNGPDSATLTGSASAQTAETFELAPFEGTLTSGGLTVAVRNTSTITAYGSAGDTGNLRGAAGVVDRFNLYTAVATMAAADRSYTNTLRSFRTVNASGNLGDKDEAWFHDTYGADTFVGTGTSATFSRTGYTNRADGFRYIRALANELANDTSRDTATLWGIAGHKDVLTARPVDFSLTDQATYSLLARGFDQATATADPNDTTDEARFYDSTGSDTFNGYETYAAMTGTGFFNQANGFDKVYAYATAANVSGAMDRANLNGSTGSDTFVAKSAYATMAGTGFFHYAGGFDKVYGYATAANAPGASDRASLYDSAGSDTFSAYPTYATMSGTGFYNYAGDFDKVYAYATTANVPGATDEANLYDSSGSDTFVAKPTYATMAGPGFYHYGTGFDTVHGYATAANLSGAVDKALLYDSSGSDTLVAKPTYATMTGPGFSSRADGFDKVYAYATAIGGSGGGAAVDRAFLYDSVAADQFYGRGVYGYLYGAGFYNYVSGFDQVTADGTQGGTNRLETAALDYLFEHPGTWI